MAPVKEKTRTKSISKSSKKSNSDPQLECEKCEKSVNNLICCERCVKWLCLVCAGNMSDDTYKLLKQEDITWFCIPCRGPAVQAAQTDKLIEDRCKHYLMKAMEEICNVKSELKGDIQNMSNKVDKLTEKVDGLDNLREDLTTVKEQVVATVKDLQRDVVDLKSKPEIESNGNIESLKQKISSLETQLDKNKEETSREITQRELRKQNVIVFNVPQSRAEDSANRNQQDSEYFMRLCNELKLDDIEITGVTRLHPGSTQNQDEDNPKPLRIRVRTEQMRTQILSKARLLKMSDNEVHRKIYIKRDMTPLERAEAVKSREKQRERERGEGRGQERAQNKH